MAYYQNKKLEQNMIFNSIAIEDAWLFRYIVGLDIGHGTTRAWCITLDTDKPRSFPLKLNSSDAYTAPTAFVYEEADFLFTGYEAAPDHIFQHFMTPPDAWNKTSPDGIHTFRDLMSDYIRSIWFDLCYHNEHLVLDCAYGTKTLLIVGCPASSRWTDNDDFCTLVKEATSINHVSVVPNARAAIVQAARSCNAEFADGVALFDIGDLTADFVYVKPGRKMITRSTEWGGNLINQGMLQEILAANSVKKHEIPLAQVDYLLSQVRTIKEEYYTHSAVTERSLHILKTDEHGSIIPPEQEPDLLAGDLPGISARTLPADINAAFMQKVLKPLLPKLEGYFRQMKGLIASLPCRTVILTGGTSQIPEVAELARSVFSQEVITLPIRSATLGIAEGLALIKYGEIAAEESICEQRKALTKFLTNTQKTIEYRWEGEIEKIFTDAVFALCQKLITSGENCKLNTFISLVEDAARKAKIPDSHRDVLCCSNLLDEWEDIITGFSSQLKDVNLHYFSAAAVTKDIRQNREAMLQSVNINKLLASIVNDLNFTRILFYRCIDDDLCKRYLSTLHRAMLSTAKYLNGTYWPILGADICTWMLTEAFRNFPEMVNEDLFPANSMSSRLEVLDDYSVALAYTDLMKKNPVLDHQAMSSIQQNMVNHSSSSYDKHFHNTLDRNANFKSLLDQLFRDLYEEALGKLLLLVFDEKADLQ